jgi:hypothetical protein
VSENENAAYIGGLREDLGRAEERIHDLEGKLAALEKRVRDLEAQTPQAQRLQYEADVAVADLAASGFADDPPIGADRHGPGCLCPYCPDEDDEALS